MKYYAGYGTTKKVIRLPTSLVTQMATPYQEENMIDSFEKSLEAAREKYSESMKIYLRDLNMKIVNSWKSVFYNFGYHYDNIDVSCGSIFDLTADAIISPANSFGFMDGGIDLAYSHYFGWDLQQQLQEYIRDKFYGEIPVGSAALIKTNNEKIRYLISAPTMRVPTDVSKTANAYLAFRASLMEVDKFNRNNDEKILSVLCPGLGTLTGFISPKNCAVQMKYAYDSIVGKNVLFPDTLVEAYSKHKYLVR